MQSELGTKLFCNPVTDECAIVHLLEQYKAYIDSAERVSDRRQATNTFFVSLNTVVLGLLGWLNTTHPLGDDVVFTMASLGGVIVCYVWYRQLLSYRALNSAKYHIIQVLEKRLPAAIYEVEWEFIERGGGGTPYVRFSRIETLLPSVFCAIYALIVTVTTFEQLQAL